MALGHCSGTPTLPSGDSVTSFSCRGKRWQLLQPAQSWLCGLGKGPALALGYAGPGSGICCEGQRGAEREPSSCPSRSQKRAGKGADKLQTA